MKKIILILLFSICTFAQREKPKYIFDKDNNLIKIEGLYVYNLSVKFPEYAMGYEKNKDSGLIYRFNVPKFNLYKFNFKNIKDTLQIICNRKFTDSSVFIIHYYHKDDNCSDYYDNNMTKSKIRDIKGIGLNNVKKNINLKNIIFIVLFEEGIILKNKPLDKNEYFFSDTNNYFKQNIFKDATLCGSNAIIHIDGNILVRNGEHRPDLMLAYLKPETWNSIFKE